MKHKKALVLILTLALAVTLAVPSLAKNASQTITAVYRNIQLVVDGVTYTPKDAGGNVVEPFIYNGTTYLPVRAVAEAFGKEVTWDGEKGIVYLGSKPAKSYKEVPLWNKPYTECSYTEVISAYEEKGVGYIKAKLNSWSSTYDWVTEDEATDRSIVDASVTYPLNACAKTLSGSFYVDGNDKTGECSLKIYNSNNKLIYSSPVMRTSTSPVDFSVDVENELTVTFVFDNNLDSGNNMNAYIKNPTILTTDYQ